MRECSFCDKKYLYDFDFCPCCGKKENDQIEEITITEDLVIDDFEEIRLRKKYLKEENKKRKKELSDKKTTNVIRGVNNLLFRLTSFEYLSLSLVFFVLALLDEKVQYIIVFSIFFVLYLLANYMRKHYILLKRNNKMMPGLAFKIIALIFVNRLLGILLFVEPNKNKEEIEYNHMDKKASCLVLLIDIFVSIAIIYLGYIFKNEAVCCLSLVLLAYYFNLFDSYLFKVKNKIKPSITDIILSFLGIPILNFVTFGILIHDYNYTFSKDEFHDVDIGILEKKKKNNNSNTKFILILSIITIIVMVVILLIDKLLGFNNTISDVLIPKMGFGGLEDSNSYRPTINSICSGIGLIAGIVAFVIGLKNMGSVIGSIITAILTLLGVSFALIGVVFTIPYILYFLFSVFGLWFIAFVTEIIILFKINYNKFDVEFQISNNILYLGASLVIIILGICLL